MERQKTILRGDNYSGIFSATPEKKKFWVEGDEYPPYLQENYKWRGHGIIEHIKTGRFYKFPLETYWNSSKKKNCLVDCLLRIENDKIDPIPNTRIIKKKSVYDLLLGQMYKNAKEGEKNEIISNIFPERLPYKKLFEKGFMKDEIGQIKLPFLYEEI